MLLSSKAAAPLFPAEQHTNDDGEDYDNDDDDENDDANPNCIGSVCVALIRPALIFGKVVAARGVAREKVARGVIAATEAGIDCDVAVAAFPLFKRSVRCCPAVIAKAGVALGGIREAYAVGVFFFFFCWAPRAVGPARILRDVVARRVVACESIEY